MCRPAKLVGLPPDVEEAGGEEVGINRGAASPVPCHTVPADLFDDGRNLLLNFLRRFVSVALAYLVD
jgi:hypothetical protein